MRYAIDCDCALVAPEIVLSIIERITTSNLSAPSLDRSASISDFRIGITLARSPERRDFVLTAQQNTDQLKRL